MRLSQKSLLLVVLFFAQLSCKTESALNSAAPVPASAIIASSGSGASVGVATSLVSTINAEVYLKIERQLYTLDSSTAKTSVGICKVAMGAPLGTIQTCTPVTGGDFSIPEGDLYFSNLTFTAGTADQANCATIIFRPYYYLGSVTALAPTGFIVPWLTTGLPQTGIECGYGKAIAGCFNGPAVSIVPSFPSNKALFFLTNQALELVSSVKSAYESKQISNRFTMNDNTAGGWLNPTTDAADYNVKSFVGDTAANGAGYANPGPTTPLGYGAGHQDYVVECRDKWFDMLYAVRVVMTDEDTVVGVDVTKDNFHTWR